MLKLKKTIQNVKRGIFGFYEEKEFYVNKENQIFLDYKFLIDDIENFQIYNEFIYLTDTKNNKYSIKLTDELTSLQQISVWFIAKTLKDNNAIFYDENLLKVYGNIVSAEIYYAIPKEFSYSYYQVKNYDLFISQNDFTEIVKFDLETGVNKWVLDIKEIGTREFRGEIKIGKVSKFIAIQNDLLFVVIGSFKFLAIDINTGQIVWRIDEGIDIYGEKTPALPMADSLQFHEERNKLIGLKNSFFVVVDIETRSLEHCHHIPDILVNKNGGRIEVIGFQIQGNQLIFTARQIGQRFHTGLIGAFNIDTQQIDWLYEADLPRGNSFIDPPRVNGNKIYVQDFEMSLHVYEKMDNI